MVLDLNKATEEELAEAQSTPRPTVKPKSGKVTADTSTHPVATPVRANKANPREQQTASGNPAEKKRQRGKGPDPDKDKQIELLKKAQCSMGQSG